MTIINSIGYSDILDHTSTEREVKSRVYSTIRLKKKILYFLFIFILIFVNVFPVHAESDKTPPAITNIIINNKNVQPGDILKISIEATDAESGFDENTCCDVELYNGARLISSLKPKYNLNTGKFEINYDIPTDLQSGNWYVDFLYLNDKAGNTKLFYNKNSAQYNFTVDSIFYGTDNISLAVGSSFEPLEGVEASNLYEGNITNKITCKGSVDTSKKGTANSKSSDFDFTIDKTSPQIVEKYPQTLDEGSTVTADKFLKAADNNNYLSY